MKNKLQKKKGRPPICQSCYDKGFYTVFAGWTGAPDFIGDKGFSVAPHIQKKLCTICKGRPKAYAKKQLKLMLISVREGGFITPVLEKIMTWI